MIIPKSEKNQLFLKIDHTIIDKSPNYEAMKLVTKSPVDELTESTLIQIGQLTSKKFFMGSR